MTLNLKFASGRIDCYPILEQPFQMYELRLKGADLRCSMKSIVRGSGQTHNSGDAYIAYAAMISWYYLTEVMQDRMLEALIEDRVKKGQLSHDPRSPLSYNLKRKVSF